ncbi:HDOD domain-containing protein [Nibricoccus sp. IMCC34717]|uniref:HDOD domain-containing protein n=1 Tax=Nibricoccus sp. IMCC34717 TaxID=3034021 RepID=UPI00384CC0F4
MSNLISSPRERILRIAQKMPASAQVLSQLGRLLMDVNSGLDDIAELLKRDASLSARILRVSNSVAYSGKERIASIEEAVNRVGFSEVYRFCGLAAAAQVFDQDLKFYGITKSNLRTNSLFTALAAEILAKRIGADMQAAYSAGLMRLIGKMVLDQLAKEIDPGMKPFGESGHQKVLAWEGIVFGMTNAGVASMILEEWKFPDSVFVPVRDQYAPDPATGDHHLIAQIVNCAAGMAVVAGYGQPGEEHEFEITPARMNLLRLNVETLELCVEQSKKALKKVLDGVG